MHYAKIFLWLCTSSTDDNDSHRVINEESCHTASTVLPHTVAFTCLSRDHQAESSRLLDMPQRTGRIFGIHRDEKGRTIFTWGHGPFHAPPFLAQKASASVHTTLTLGRQTRKLQPWVCAFTAQSPRSQSHCRTSGCLGTRPTLPPLPQASAVR